MTALRHLLPWALLIAMPVAVAGGLYKWTDAEGNVVFSDKPPPAAEAPSSEVEGYSPLTVKQAIEQEREAAARRRQQARQRAAYQAEVDRIKGGELPTLEPGEDTFTCAQAKQRLAIQSRGYQNMYAPNSDGTYSKLDDDAVAGLKASWQAIADRVCAKEAKAKAKADSADSAASGG